MTTKLFPDCKCRFCGHEWNARTPDPKACPSCRRYSWRIGPKVTR